MTYKREAPAYVPNILDRCIGFISPQAGLKREQARFALGYVREARRFDGASKTSRFEQWKRPGGSANSTILPALATLRNASRDLTRNNPWAENALRVIVNNTVGGTGMTGQMISKNEPQKKMLLEKWQNWAGTSEIDSEGRLDLAGIQALAMHTIAESGEVLIRRRYRRSNNFLTVPIQLQILEPDYLDGTKDGDLASGGKIVGGVEYNKQGARVAYWLYENHPGDVGNTFRGGFQSYRIPATEIIHAFDPKRANGARGYPWCASAIRRLKDFDDFEDAQLVRQKIAACFVGVIEDIQAPTGSTGLEKQGPTESQKEFMQPGMWEHAPPGRKVTFSSPPGVGNYGEYARFVLLGAAAGWGITYEAMTNDYSGVNFSSGRMGWLEMGRNITRWQNMVMRVQVLDRIAAWFFAGITLAGENSEGAYISWVPPKREMMDPTKEVPAAIKAVRGGLTSLSRVHASMGVDSEEVINEIEATNKILDTKKITLDSDPRRVNSAGSLNEETEPPNNKDD